MQLILANRALLEAFRKPYKEQWKKEKKKKFNKWTGKKREEMYGNVLMFPAGADHLKYFEKNPHPDKISDKDALFYELFNKAPATGKKMEFELIRQLLDEKLSDFEKELPGLWRLNKNNPA